MQWNPRGGKKEVFEHTYSLSQIWIFVGARPGAATVVAAARIAPSKTFTLNFKLRNEHKIIF